MEEVIRKVKCTRCGFEWFPRTPEPPHRASKEIPPGWEGDEGFAETFHKTGVNSKIHPPDPVARQNSTLARKKRRRTSTVVGLTLATTRNGSLIYGI